MQKNCFYYKYNSVFTKICYFFSGNIANRRKCYKNIQGKAEILKEGIIIIIIIIIINIKDWSLSSIP
jgi:hypothetical protein